VLGEVYWLDATIAEQVLLCAAAAFGTEYGGDPKRYPRMPPNSSQDSRGGRLTGLRASGLIGILLLAAACVMYAARGTQPVRDWHPVFAPVLDSLGFPGHNGHSHEHPVAHGAFTDGAPVTSCWDYDFWAFEMDCDGLDHYKALVSDSRIGALKGDPSMILYPPQAKACATLASGRRVCVSDWRYDHRLVWRDTHGEIVSHELEVGCPGPRFELPCKSED
jgi:hypothetical protein